MQGILNSYLAPRAASAKIDAVSAQLLEAPSERNR
jgi:hypothetical protein